MQRTEKRPGARRATVGLAVANSRKRNNEEGRLSACPKGAHPIGQCGVTALGKGWAIAGGLRLALADWVDSAPANIALIEY
jgi:hypothetical protein